MHVNELLLESVTGRLAKEELKWSGLLHALSEVTEAMPRLFDVDGAGILLADEEQVLRHFASTDASAKALEKLQESTGRGPCVQSLVEDAVVGTPDVLADPRWADMGQLLADNGVRSILGAPVHLLGAPLGSLNVYKKSVHIWDDSDHRAIAAFGCLAERLITASLALERSEVVVDQLQEALRARVEIERAIGIVMALEDLDAVDAFERVRRLARSTRRPVREIASDIIRYKKIAKAGQQDGARARVVASMTGGAADVEPGKFALVMPTAAQSVVRDHPVAQISRKDR